MIVLFTDFGVAGPYIGQIETALYQNAPEAKVINLITDAPRNNPKYASYLLAALSGNFPEGTIFFCVVDPGVGDNVSAPVVLSVDGKWFVGPDNGLFDKVALQGEDVSYWAINWRPEQLSDSFHGRDLYAPVCAMLFRQESPPGDNISWQDKHGWPADLSEVIYLDHFGNVMTGIRYSSIKKSKVFIVDGTEIHYAKTFSSVNIGAPFWYGNSIGLVEIAVNQGSAASQLGLNIGDSV